MSAAGLKLYHYWRSSASWRVRWALNLKKIPHELIHVSIINGESQSETHLKRNPFGQVPVLEYEGKFLSESLAIIQFLEQLFPASSLLPQDPFLKARAWQLAEVINAGTQPIQNLGVMKKVTDDEAKRKEWAQYWIARGLKSYETWLKGLAGKFSVGDQVTVADLCLIPQVYNAKRFEVDLKPFPTIQRIYDHALTTEACAQAEPSRYEPKS